MSVQQTEQRMLTKFPRGPFNFFVNRKFAYFVPFCFRPEGRLSLLSTVSPWVPPSGGWEGEDDFRGLRLLGLRIPAQRSH